MKFTTYRSIMTDKVLSDKNIPDDVASSIRADLSERDFVLIDASEPYQMIDVGDDWLAGLGEVFKDLYGIATRPPFDNCWLEASDPVEKLDIGVAVSRRDDDKDEWSMLTVVRHWKYPFAIVSPGVYRFKWDNQGILQPQIEIGAWVDSDKALKSVATTRVFTNIAVVTFALLHCKNVELVERLPKRHEQREAKRRGEPILKYHEIVIDPGKTKQVAVGAGSASQDHPSRALHIARGHFATYTEDKPLFGKYTGTFWRPAHVRGSAEVGTVTSTYKVKGQPQ